MTESTIVKVIISIFSLIGFLFFNWIRSIRKNLNQQIENKTYKLTEKYVLKSDFEKFVSYRDGILSQRFDRVEEKLNRIEDKLDKKQDKVK